MSVTLEKRMLHPETQDYSQELEFLVTEGVLAINNKYDVALVLELVRMGDDQLKAVVSDDSLRKKLEQNPLFRFVRTIVLDQDQPAAESNFLVGRVRRAVVEFLSDKIAQISAESVAVLTILLATEDNKIDEKDFLSLDSDVVIIFRLMKLLSAEERRITFLNGSLRRKQ